MRLWIQQILFLSLMSWMFCVFVCGCQLLSCVPLFVTPWTVAHKAPLSMEFSRQEYWSQLTFPTPRDCPKPGIKLGSPVWQADSSPFEPAGTSASSLFICQHEDDKECASSGWLQASFPR